MRQVIVPKSRSRKLPMDAAPIGSLRPRRLLSCRCVLPYPQSIAIWIIKSKLYHAIKGGIHVRDMQSPPSHLLVILHYIFRIQVENGLARRVQMKIDRLIYHQMALVKAEHSPIPIIIPSLNAESEFLIELDAGWHALHRQHRH